MKVNQPSTGKALLRLDVLDKASWPGHWRGRRPTPSTPSRCPDPRAQRHADGADGADEPPEPPPQPRADSSDGAVDGADDPPNPALTALDNPPTFAADAASRTFFRWLDKSRLYPHPRSAFRPVGCSFHLTHTQLAALKFCPGASPHRPSPELFK